MDISLSSLLKANQSELILSIGILFILLWGSFAKNQMSRLFPILAGLVLIGALGGMFIGEESFFQKFLLFDGAFIHDAYSQTFKGLVLLSSLICLILSWDFLKSQGLASFEFSILLLIANLGMMILISAHNFLTLYLGLELMSLALYILAALHRDHLRSTEAGLKYFVLGALSSGILLYGLSLLYGASGSTSFSVVTTAFQAPHSLIVVFGLVFVMIGLAFKMSAVPFHMWTPDVYEGAPTPVTAFFASAPKLAALVITSRFLIGALHDQEAQWQQILVVISALSMILGAFAAIGQTQLKRLLAYSSIGHMGFVLMGMSANNSKGVASLVIYAIIYIVMTLGVFAALLSLRIEGRYIETIEDLKGLATRHGSMAFHIAMVMFSLAGIPPLAGFFAKLYVLDAALSAHFYTLAIIGVLSSCVACFYYLRIVKVMYFDEESHAFERPVRGPKNVLEVMSVILMFFWILSPLDFTRWGEALAHSLF